MSLTLRAVWIGSVARASAAFARAFTRFEVGSVRNLGRSPRVLEVKILTSLTMVTISQSTVRLRWVSLMLPHLPHNTNNMLLTLSSQPQTKQIIN